MLGRVRHPQVRSTNFARRITETMDFMKAVGITSETNRAARDRFLHQPRRAAWLREALTRVDSTSGDWYATSAT